MSDDKLSGYDEAMRQGRYLDGLDIVLRANAPEGATDEEIYAEIMDEIFWWTPKRAKPKPDAEREEYYARLRIERPELFVK